MTEQTTGGSGTIPPTTATGRPVADPKRLLYQQRGLGIPDPRKARGAGMLHNLDKHGTYVVGPGKVGRNDPCACGSGKKAKKCHPRGIGPSPGLCQGTDPPHQAEGTIRLKSPQRGDLDICRKHLTDILTKMSNPHAQAETPNPDARVQEQDAAAAEGTELRVGHHQEAHG